MERVGIYRNSHKQYLKWGSIANPLTTASFILLNWVFRFTMFYMIGFKPQTIYTFALSKSKIT